MTHIENSGRKANDRRSGTRGSNIRLPEWNKTERNTPGVSSPLLDNQALATIKTERPFRFPLTNARRNEKYTEPIRSNPDLHTRTVPILTSPTTTAPQVAPSPLSISVACSAFRNNRKPKIQIRKSQTRGAWQNNPMAKRRENLPVARVVFRDIVQSIEDLKERKYLLFDGIGNFHG
jgi:hypothetical protein